MPKLTAIARYQLNLQTPNRTIGKRLRKAAWNEANALICQGLARDASVIQQLRDDAATRTREVADSLYGAQKYGRDVEQPLIIPTYKGKPPTAPEHGFAFIAILGKRKHLWYEGAWVELSGALMRELSSTGLRVALAHACRFQECRNWASHYSALTFRDQVIDVKHFYKATQADREWWPHLVPMVRK